MDVSKIISELSIELVFYITNPSTEIRNNGIEVQTTFCCVPQPWARLTCQNTLGVSNTNPEAKLWKQFLSSNPFNCGQPWAILTYCISKIIWETNPPSSWNVGRILFMNPRIHPFFFAGDMTGPHSDSTLKIFWILRKIESTLFFSQQKKMLHIITPLFIHISSTFKSFEVSLADSYPSLGSTNACFNSSQAVGSPGKTRTTSGERRIFFWNYRVLCKEIGSWNPESIRIHYCHALGESKQQYLGIMAGHMCGKRICL